MTHSERVLRTPGKPPTFIQPRDNGGWTIRQGKNHRVHLAADEAAMLAVILTGEPE